MDRCGSFHYSLQKLQTGMIVYLSCGLKRKGNKCVPFMGFFLFNGYGCHMWFDPREPHLSASVLIGMTTLIMLFVGGANMIHMIGMVPLAFALALMFTINKPYRLKRLLSFLDP